MKCPLLMVQITEKITHIIGPIDKLKAAINANMPNTTANGLIP